MAFQFRKAARTRRKIRVAVDGPSGSGKTFSLLRLAFALKAAGLCKAVAVIDTENGGSESYAGEVQDGQAWDFQVCNLDSYNPKTYVDALSAAVEAGFDCVVIDSLSHAWVGKDGALDMVDRKGGRFDAWKDVTPVHRMLFDAVIHSPAHVLASMRTKSEYVVEKDDRGRSVPRKVGLAPVQRDGVEFEFDLYGSIDLDHVLRISKSRCSAMQDQFCPKPDARFWSPLVKWLSSAEPVVSPAEDARDRIAKAPSVDALAAVWKALPTDLQNQLLADKDRRKAELIGAPAPQQPASPPPAGNAPANTPPADPDLLRDDLLARLDAACERLGVQPAKLVERHRVQLGIDPRRPDPPSGALSLPQLETLVSLAEQERSLLGAGK